MSKVIYDIFQLKKMMIVLFGQNANDYKQVHLYMLGFKYSDQQKT